MVDLKMVVARATVDSIDRTLNVLQWKSRSYACTRRTTWAKGGKPSTFALSRMRGRLRVSGPHSFARVGIWWQPRTFASLGAELSVPWLPRATVSICTTFDA